MNLVYVILLMLVQLSGCASMLCSLDIKKPFALQDLWMAHRELEDVLRTSTDELIIVERRVSSVTGVDVVQLRPTGERVVASLPSLQFADMGASVIAGEGSWWFSRFGVLEDETSLVTFVTGGDDPQQAKVKVPHGNSPLWLPIRGNEPRGLLISIENDQPALRVDEVTPHGVKRLGGFDWWATGAHFTQPHPSQWSAQDLGGGRFALVAVDGPPDDQRLWLRIIGSGTPSESLIPWGLALDLPISTAFDGAGKLAIVGLSKARQVVAVIANIDRPQAAVYRVISGAGGTAAQTFYGSPSVISTAEGIRGGLDYRRRECAGVRTWESAHTAGRRQRWKGSGANSPSAATHPKRRRIRDLPVEGSGGRDHQPQDAGASKWFCPFD